MEKLKLSKYFTIEDIHKVRSYNYEKRKDMTFEEEKDDIVKGADAMLALIEKEREEAECLE